MANKIFAGHVTMGGCPAAFLLGNQHSYSITMIFRSSVGSNATKVLHIADHKSGGKLFREGDLQLSPPSKRITTSHFYHCCLIHVATYP